MYLTQVLQYITPKKSYFVLYKSQTILKHLRQTISWGLKAGPKLFVLHKGTPPVKKMFSFGHCPNEGGGEAPARIKKYNIYIYI